jgi:integrase
MQSNAWQGKGEAWQSEAKAWQGVARQRKGKAQIFKEYKMRKRRPGPIRRRSGDRIDPPKVLTESEKTAVETLLKNRWSGLPKPVSRRDVTAFRDYLIVQLMLATGIRRSELCNLRLKDTPDWIGRQADEDDVIYIHDSKFRKDRTIPISTDLADMLRLYIKNYRPRLMPRHICKADGSKPVFYSGWKHKLQPNSLYYNIVRFGRRAGLKKHITPHKLRHTWFTDNIGDIGIDGIMDLGGHNSLQTTQKYSHYVLSRKAGLGEIMDRRIKTKKNPKGQRYLPYS